MLLFIWLNIHSCVHVGAAVGGTVWSCMGEVGGAVGQPPPLHVGRQSVFMSAVTLCTLLTPPYVPRPLSCTSVGSQSVFTSAITLYPLLTPPNVPRPLSCTSVGGQSVFKSAVTLYPLLTHPNVPHYLSWYTWSVCSSVGSSRWSSSPDTAHQLTCTGPLSQTSTCHLYW